MRNDALGMFLEGGQCMWGYMPLDIGSFIIDISNHTYGTATSSAGVVTLTRNSDSATSSGGAAQIHPDCGLCGDFDLTLTYNLTIWSVPTTSEWFSFRVFDPLVGGYGQSITIERYQTPIAESVKTWLTGGDDIFSTCPADALTTGKFRVARCGSIVTAYYWTAGVWVAMRSKTGANAANWKFNLYIGKSSGTNTVAGNFSNMSVGVSNYSSSLLTGLKNYYQLNGQSSDAAGSASGTDTAIIYEAGKLGSCATFNGTTSGISFTPTTLYTGLSWACWVKTTNAGTDLTHGGKNALFASASTYACLSVDNKKATYCHWVSGAFQSLQGVADINDGAWHFVAVTHSATTNAVTLYVDDSTPVTATMTYDTTHTQFDRLGYSYSTYGRCAGSIDEAGCWNRALSSSEVSELRNGGYGKTFPFPI